MKSWEGQASSGLRTIRREHLIARLPESVSHCMPAVITLSSSKSQGSTVSGVVWEMSGYIKTLKMLFFPLSKKWVSVKNWFGKAVLFGDLNSTENIYYVEHTVNTSWALGPHRINIVLKQLLFRPCLLILPATEVQNITHIQVQLMNWTLVAFFHPSLPHSSYIKATLYEMTWNCGQCSDRHTWLIYRCHTLGPGLVLHGVTCGFPLGCMISSSFQKHACRWTGYAKL